MKDGLVRVSQMVSMTDMPSVRSLTALVRIGTADCSLYFTDDQVFSLLERALLLISSSCVLNCMLIGNEEVMLT